MFPLQPSVLLLPYVEGNPKDSEAAIARFRTEVKPVFEHIVHAPTFNAVAHASDASFSNLPSSSLNGGVAFGDLWEDVIIHVFGEWVAFTENEDTKGSMLMWEFGVKDKIAEVPRTATAFALRDPHYYAVVTGR